MKYKQNPDGTLQPLEGCDALWTWFGLSHACWLAIPRALMHEMPDEWQAKMAALLNEWDEHWDFPLDLGIGHSVVLMRDERGRLSKWPEWLVQYRHPDDEAIAAIVAKPCDEAENEKELAK